MTVSLRPATAADAPALAALQRRAFQRLYERYHDEGSPYLRGEEEIFNLLERPNWQVYQVLAGGVLCGGVYFCEREAGEYYLARIYIDPAFQGQGIAPEALRLCEATVSGARRWYLDYPVTEERNRRCYEKAGYHDTGERREQSGGAITLGYMEKYV